MGREFQLDSYEHSASKSARAKLASRLGCGLGLIDSVYFDVTMKAPRRHRPESSALPYLSSRAGRA